MTQNWRTVVIEETAKIPTGAQARVWAALNRPRPSPIRRMVIFNALPVLAAAAVAGVVFWPSTQTKTFQTSGSVVAVTDGTSEYEPKSNRISLEKGTLAASVWSDALRVQVKGHEIVAQAASMVVRVEGENVTIAPVQGFITVDGQRVDATDATRALAGTANLGKVQPVDVSIRVASRLADLEIEASNFDAATQALGVVGKSRTMAAEAALLRKGEIELRELHDPVRALATFDDAFKQFPMGSLAEERSVSALEAEVQLKRWSQASSRAERFLAQYPTSEHEGEVRKLYVSALMADGRTKEACGQLRHLPAGSVPHFESACQ